MGTQKKGTHLDLWQDSYAARAHNLRESEIRALFSVVSRPEVVSLAGGMPNIHDLPLAELAEGAKELVLNHGEQAMQYGSGQGWAPLRESITEVMAAEGINANPDNVVITTGSQQALDLVTQLFIEPGDVILAESPSYVGALGVFNAYQADVRHVGLDDQGLIPEEFASAVEQARGEGKRIKYLYTIPNFHNPAGVSMSIPRRKELVELCRKYGVLILEDNPYGLLGFEGQTITPLVELAPDLVVYLGSFSKIFAPGFRIGWAYAPPAVRDKLIVASESAILSPSMVGQMAIHAYLRDYDWRRQIDSYRQMYRGRRDAMLDALATYLPECTWTIPEGGFYTWLTLPSGMDSKAMLSRAVTELVAYTPGTAFYADNQGRENLRLSFCYPPADEIREGVRRLAKVVEREIELLKLFGSQERH
ncbi:MAG: PLP-dependent aminotransferase family protein [Varibaculum timonense]